MLWRRLWWRLFWGIEEVQICSNYFENSLREDYLRSHTNMVCSWDYSSGISNWISENECHEELRKDYFCPLSMHVNAGMGSWANKISTMYLMHPNWSHATTVCVYIHNICMRMHVCIIIYHSQPGPKTSMQESCDIKEDMLAILPLLHLL